MKASRPDSESFCFEFFRRVLAVNTRLLLIVTACLFLAVPATAAQPPTITIDAASQVTGISAIIGWTVNPNGLSTSVVLRWGTTTAYEQGSSYLLSAPVDLTLTQSNLLTGLTANTTYHYQLVATNSAGATLSPDMTFTTAAEIPVPVVTINPATDVTAYSATITGSVNPKGIQTPVLIQWGTTVGYGASKWLGTVPAQNAPAPVNTTLTNLIPNTTYHCQFAASNVFNLGAVSADISFTTLEGPPPPPTAVTGPATDITGTSATIYGDLNPNGLDTTFYFHWGTNTAFGNTTPSSWVPAQNTPINGIARSLTGLSPGTTYHYELVAINDAGAFFGGDKSFTTLSAISIQGQTFIYSTNNGTVTITEYDGPGGAVTIPSTIAGLPVTAIANNVFGGVTNLTSVTLPDILTSLGDLAFIGCKGLTGIALPNSLTYLGFASFAGCSALISASLSSGLTDLQNSVFQDCTSLTSVTIPNSVTNIGVRAFSNCGSLTNLIIGNGMLNIGQAAFWHCTNLTTVAIPASTLSIDMSGWGDGAFGGCTGLSAINVDPLNTVYSSADGVLFNKAQTTLLLYPQSKSAKNYVMPSSVVVIGDSAFINCSNLTAITIGTNVAYISNWAFFGCSGLTRVTIPDSVTNTQDAPVGAWNSVAGGVFYGCSRLTNVIVGKGLTHLGLGTFFCENLLGVYFEGNAPTPGNTGWSVSVFYDSGTVYYLPGTTGWDSTYAGRPTKLWNPQLQDYSSSSGPDQSHFTFTVRGTADIPLLIETSTNPVAATWSPLQTCTLTNGQISFTDPGCAQYPVRFYRITPP